MLRSFVPNVRKHSRGALRNRDLVLERDTKELIRAAMESDFLPEPSLDTLSQVDCRMANAAEYIADHLARSTRSSIASSSCSRTP
jgi:hypothetical protein